MFKIELTQALGWDSPAVAALQTMEPYLCDAEKFARQWLKGYQEENPESRRERLSHPEHTRQGTEGKYTLN